jgi:hypothetical protein
MIIMLVLYITDSRNRFNYNDETDQDHSVLTWWMRNLTPGTTYYISPYFRGTQHHQFIFMLDIVVLLMDGLLLL